MAGVRSWIRLDAQLLHDWPLPEVPRDADKETRGRTLVIGGSREIAGAAVLSGTAALRAGAGKLVVATAASMAAQVSLALPEARVIALPENGGGSFSVDGVPLVSPCVEGADAVVLGPGLMDEKGSVAFVSRVVSTLGGTAAVVDALAMKVVEDLGRFAHPVVMTPHAGEMASLLGMAKEDVLAHPEDTAASAAARWNAVVVLKGATTLIASPTGEGWRHDSGHPGLATSGSGDVLAGIIGGLLARGAPLEQAAAWGVALHALAGAALEQRHGPLGYLARELPEKVPALMRDCAIRPSRPAGS